MTDFAVQFNPNISKANKPEQTNINRNNEISFLHVMQEAKASISQVSLVPSSNSPNLMGFFKREEEEKMIDRDTKWTTVYDLIAKIERMGKDGKCRD